MDIQTLKTAKIIEQSIIHYENAISHINMMLQDNSDIFIDYENNSVSCKTIIPTEFKEGILLNSLEVYKRKLQICRDSLKAL